MQTWPLKDACIDRERSVKAFYARLFSLDWGLRDALSSFQVARNQVLGSVCLTPRSHAKPRCSCGGAAAEALAVLSR